MYFNIDKNIYYIYLYHKSDWARVFVAIWLKNREPYSPFSWVRKNIYIYGHIIAWTCWYPLPIPVLFLMGQRKRNQKPPLFWKWKWHYIYILTNIKIQLCDASIHILILFRCFQSESRDELKKILLKEW